MAERRQERGWVGSLLLRIRKATFPGVWFFGSFAAGAGCQCCLNAFSTDMGFCCWSWIWYTLFFFSLLISSSRFAALNLGMLDITDDASVKPLYFLWATPWLGLHTHLLHSSVCDSNRSDTRRITTRPYLWDSF